MKNSKQGLPSGVGRTAIKSSFYEALDEFLSGKAVCCECGEPLLERSVVVAPVGKAKMAFAGRFSNTGDSPRFKCFEHCGPYDAAAFEPQIGDLIMPVND